MCLSCIFQRLRITFLLHMALYKFFYIVLYRFWDIQCRLMACFEIWVKVTHTANLCTICHRWNRQTQGYRFAADGVCLSSFSSTQRTREKAIKWCITVVQCHRTPICSFLSLHCNYMPIFYRFRDIMTYWSYWRKHPFFRRFTHPSLKPSQGGLTYGSCVMNWLAFD